ncbi:hypothetical protein BDV25DRAFT_172763 [Aspergillus avenaceus]|uniref:Amidohydrolase-related domain-containing protein n=1 Tax=Aspergillus avenaceus TaxID=36643 RepID=A0A5N6TU13_ASPAV|nr:hypothetical protein BDV25DRAFT_172763 [Aspergillus avenaceus]
MPLITLEEHYISPKVRASSASARAHYSKFPGHILTKLEDLDAQRIQDMNDGKVSLQVLSHGPGDFPTSLCQTANDDLFAAISRHPGRLAGFAMLPMSDPVAAAEELERCVKSLGFLGALVENHLDGQFYDDERFSVVFGKAVELNVPIYIHPTFAGENMMNHYRGSYPDNTAEALSAFGWGWHADTGLHFLRLYASGLFDRFPGLKLVLGHMGELLPFQLDRIFGIAERWGRRRNLRDVWRENVWVTTSGMFSVAPLACLLRVSDSSRVLYSVDYPFSGNERGLAFLEEVRESGLMGEEELRGFMYGNAERLLGVRV